MRVWLSKKIFFLLSQNFNHHCRQPNTYILDSAYIKCTSKTGTLIHFEAKPEILRRDNHSVSIFFLLLASTMCIVAQAMPSTTIVEISRIVVLVGKLPSHFSYFGVPNTYNRCAIKNPLKFWLPLLSLRTIFLGKYPGNFGPSLETLCYY